MARGGGEEEEEVEIEIEYIPYSSDTTVQNISCTGMDNKFINHFYNLKIRVI
jgi:hypothetical protein